MTEEIPSTTGCVCPLSEATWLHCPLHNFVMHRVWRENCFRRHEWHQRYLEGERHQPVSGPAVEREPEPPLEGVGDVLAAVFERTGVKWFAERAAKLAGLSGCNCETRRQLLNELLPVRPDGITNRVWAAVIKAAGKQA